MWGLLQRGSQCGENLVDSNGQIDDATDQAVASLRERVGSLFGPAATGNGAAETADGDSVPFDVAGLIAKAEAKLDDAGEEDRSEMIDLIEAIRDARKAGDRDRLAEACEQLNDLLFYLET